MKVDLWLARLDKIPEEDGRDLAREELERADRFVRPELKIKFIKRRSILRKLLSEYLDIKPNEMVIDYSNLGKPYVANPKTKIFFNISHSKDCVLYGFSREAEIGVDIESLNDEIEAELISNHFFASDEISLIRNSTGRVKADAFFRLWCIKEAYIKLVGKGLTFPLDQVLVKDTMENPRLEVPAISKNQSFQSLSCIYSNFQPSFGIGVVVRGNHLEIEYKQYKV
ncbi:4'-phosphopantetheinyl transferase superfamily protein [Algoriphagus lutimaris]|uniref:4'-phosphopantetheinyl transferase family protein n=1 Tax=Algoriphagus lutimaris TaxID=613197 RepID=UPI00196A5255|nr:4'-phosphopantetheinyl transferase superfamily protein [Algoriphagus lutimaris]MBN3519252.1 4'-phosphopantetheinyl transferase superfamily protein [Algoriphagus lutimaris]